MGVLSKFSFSPQSLVAAVVGGGFVCCAFYWAYRSTQTRPVPSADIPPDNGKLKLQFLLNDSAKVHIADKDKVEGIIRRMIGAGAAKLQVISDFDRTLTPTLHNGAPVPSCHCVIEQHGDLPPHIKEAADKVRDFYFKIEFDPNMTREEKYPYMVEWWTKAHDFLVQSALTKSQIHQAVADSNLFLREGCKEMLKSLHKRGVPLLIFSAGLGDIIESLLQQRYLLYDNIKIVSNWMDFNNQGNVVGFKGTNIHVFNKNAHAIEHSDYFDKNRDRSNIILIGDSLGDLDMAEGAPVITNILKIGYLNDRVQDLLESYKSQYDIVLTSEPSLDLVSTLIGCITSA